MFGVERCFGGVEGGFAEFEDFGEFEFALQPVQRPQQIPFNRGEITAQRVFRKEVFVPCGDRLQALRRVLGEAWIETEILWQFADFLRLLDQALLEARVTDVQQRFDHYGIGFTAQISDAVFGHDDIAQVPWDRTVTVFPDDVGTDVATGFTPAAQDQNRTGIVQRVTLRDEVVLPADSAEYSPILQLIRHTRTEQGHGEHGVDEPRIQALQALEFFLPVELVDVADAGHVEFEALALRQLAQTFIEAARAEEETSVHRDAVSLCRFVEGAGVGLFLRRHIRVDLTPDDPGIRQHQQAVDEHFAAAVQAFGERSGAALALNQPRPLAEIDVMEQGLITGVIRLTRQQCGGQRVAHRADAYLQRTPVAHQRTRVQANEMILKTDGHVRRGKQRAVVLGVDQQVEGIDVDFGIAGHIRQIGVDLADQQNGFPGVAALGDHRQQVEGDVRVAAQAQAIRMFAAAGEQLRHQVQAGGVDVAGGVAVVAADVILLGRGAVEQAAGLHEELFDADVGGQAVAVQVGEEIEFRVITEDALDEGFDKAFLQAITQRRAAEAQRGVDRQLPLGQAFDPPVQRVDEVIGFAQPQRHAHVDMRRQARQHVIHCLFDRTQLHHLKPPARSVNRGRPRLP